MAMLIEQRVALRTRNTTVVPRLADEMRPIAGIRPPLEGISLTDLATRHSALAVRLRQVLAELLEIIARHQTDLSLTVPRFVPFRIRRWTVEDLEAIALLERQLLIIVRRERIESHHDVEHVLGHRVRVERVVGVALFLGVVRREPAGLSAALTSPPAVIALLEYQNPGAFHEGELVRLLRLVIVLDDRGADRLARIGRQASCHDG